MAKRRRFSFRRRHGRKDNRLPLLPAIGLAQNFVRPLPSGNTLISDIQQGNFEHLLYDARECFIGMDANGQFHPDWLVSAYMPLVVGFLASRVATAVGANKIMKRIPVVGRYIKL